MAQSVLTEHQAYFNVIRNNRAKREREKIGKEKQYKLIKLAEM